MLYIDMSDAEFCKQRTIALQYNVPLPRFTPINPYVTYTKFQLDMRRKAEILKYSANKSSTQTNNLTKKQSYALLARGSLPTPTQATLQSGSVNCDIDQTIPTPSSSCNVPGPIVYLYEDPTVPLYNYSDFNTRTYPEAVPTDNVIWKIVGFSDVVLQSRTQGNLFYLIISNYIELPKHTFDMSVPVGITISGTRKSGILPANITASVKSMTLTIYYNSSIVSTIQTPNVGNNTGLNIVFDVSNSTPGAFKVTQYLGTININEIELFTSPTYVYSFLASFTLTLYSDSTTLPNINDLVDAYFEPPGLNVKIVANMSPNTNSLTNCRVTAISGEPANEFNTINMGGSLVEHS